MGLHIEVIKIGECALTDSQHEEMRERGELRPHFEESDEYKYYMFAQEFSGVELEAGWYKTVSLTFKSMGSYTGFREFRRTLARVKRAITIPQGTLYIHNIGYLQDPDHFLNVMRADKSDPLHAFLTVADDEGILTPDECKLTLKQFKTLEPVMAELTEEDFMKYFKRWIDILELTVSNEGAYIKFS